MKIIITGSLGNISKPLTIELLQNGHRVTVISSNPQKQKDIEALGAKAAIGSLESVDFLTATFAGADAVYCMIPPNNYFNHDLDLLTYYSTVAANYFKAIEATAVRSVVYLSSVGAHLKHDSGIIIVHHAGEEIMSRLSSDVAISFMRPVGFYYNLLGFVNVIKQKGLIEANYGADEHLVWVSPIDIAAAVAEELTTILAGRKIRYVVSDELSGNETASILGEAIGKPGLKWKLIPGEQWLADLKRIGMNSSIAAGLVEMFESQHNGLLTEDYYLNKPASSGKVKMKDFAKQFAIIFNK
jgi:uncharacterized protein YbjT (DUF2867 family)